MLLRLDVFVRVRCLTQVSHLDRPLPHDLAQFSNVVVLLNGCSQVTIVLGLRLRLSTKRALWE